MHKKKLEFQAWIVVGEANKCDVEKNQKMYDNKLIMLRKVETDEEIIEVE